MLNGTKEDVEVLKSRMEERRLRARLGKVTGSCAPLPSPPLLSPEALAGLQGLPAASAQSSLQTTSSLPALRPACGD